MRAARHRPALVQNPRPSIPELTKKMILFNLVPGDAKSPFLRLAPRPRIFRTAPFVVAMLLLLGVPADAQEKAYKPQVGQAGKDGVWVPTPDEIVKAMLDLAQVAPGDRVIDLGSGDG